MSRKRRRFSGELKAKVALDAHLVGRDQPVAKDFAPYPDFRNSGVMRVLRH